MTRNLGVVASALLTLGFVAYACTSGEVVEGPVGTGSGGSNPAGNAGTNGSGTAGTTGNRGGTTGGGGTFGPGTAGTTSRGGTTGQAGVNGSRGGTTGQAGTFGPGTAGTFATAGTTGSGTAGTSGGACSTAFEVQSDGWVRLPAAGGGCWHGYASAGGDAASTLMPTTFSSCGMPCMLRIMGMLNASTMANMYAGYGYLGFNVGENAGAGGVNTPVTPRGASITPTYTTTPAGVIVRAQITGASGMRYCAPATSGTAIPYSSFKVECYNTTPGATYASSDPIANFQLSLTGGATTQSITVTLTNVSEN